MRFRVHRLGLTATFVFIVLLLGASLYLQIKQPIVTHSASPPAPSYTVQKVDLLKEDLDRYISVVRLDLLGKYQSQTWKGPTRDLFEFVDTQKPATSISTRALNPSSSSPPLPARKPPTGARPRGSLKLSFIGYSESTVGVRQAILKDEKRIYLVQEGDRVGRHYKVARISPSTVEIENELSRTRQQLRFVP